jgi:hypothetical protein
VNPGNMSQGNELSFKGFAVLHDRPSTSLVRSVRRRRYGPLKPEP